MHERCEACGLKFEREEGYFLGAMQVDYALGIVAVSLLALVIWLITHWSFGKTAVARANSIFAAGAGVDTPGPDRVDLVRPVGGSERG